MRTIHLSLAFFAAIICSVNAQSSTVRINGTDFKNLYMINESLYRSDQPSAKGMDYLTESGIKTVINFRHKQTDHSKIGDNVIKLIHYPINTNRINEEDLLNVLRLIQDSPKPVLIHCKHGSDRTGAIIGAYRMIQEGWSAEQAINELRMENYGYHETWFPNIIELLNNLDVNPSNHQLFKEQYQK